MDIYEAFIDEYVAFYTKYKEADGTNPSMLSDYAAMLSKYNQFSSDFDKWEEEDMNDAETAYYIEVQSRSNKKLLDALD